jgi:flagellar hook-associated protein 2
VGLSSAGIGSNLDVEGIVTKLMTVEQKPLVTLNTKEASFQAKLSGFGTLKGALSSFQTAVRGLSDISKFQGVRTSVGDSSVATVSGTGAAKPATYALKVTQLAQAQKLVAAGTASDIAPIGNGVITFDFGTTAGTPDVNGKYGTPTTFTSSGSGVKTVTIDPTNNSLSGIRDAINNAAIGVTATIVNDGGASPYRLALTSNATGKQNSMKISVTDMAAPDAPAGTAPGTALSGLLANDPAGSQALSQTAAAQNAEFTIDGIAVSKAGNSVSDVISGVTLNLLKENPLTATSVSVSRDTASVSAAVNSFVSAYNDISQNLRDAAAYNATTGTAAILNGEASVRSMQTQIRSVLTTPIAGGATTLSRLSEIGVTMQKDGTLAVDSGKLSASLDSNFNDFAGLFAAAGKASDSLVSYAGTSSTTMPGSYGVNITSLATKGYSVGSSAAGLGITSLNNTLEVKLNGISAMITLTPNTYATPAALAAEIQSKINGATAFSSTGSAASVTEKNGVLTVTSNTYGATSAITIGGAGQANLKFDTGANVMAGLDVAGTINGAPASGSGQLLTASAGDPSAGLSILISGGATGARGTVNYSQGYAYQFDKMATSMLSDTGPLSSRTTGIAASIKTIEKNRADLTARLAVVEKRYRAQFTALDLTISKMNTTSTFLTQQLTQISNLTAK